MLQWICMLILLYGKVFALGDVCDFAIPLLVNTTTFFLPRPLTPTSGCDTKSITDKNIRYENHAILIKPQNDQLPSKANLNLVSTKPLLSQHKVSLVLDSRNTHWLVNMDTITNTQFKFMVHESSSLEVTRKSETISPTSFTDDYGGINDYQYQLFQRNFVTSFVEIHHSRIVNITLEIGAAYSGEEERCIPQTGFLPRHISIFIFINSTNYKESCQSQIANNQLHIIHLDNIELSAAVTLRYYSSIASLSNMYIVLKTTSAVDWSLLVTVLDDEFAKSLHFIIDDDDDSTLTSDLPVDIVRHDLSTLNYFDTLLHMYNVQGYTYTRHSYTPFIIFTPDGVETLPNVYSILFGPIKKKYNEEDLVHMLLLGRCDCYSDLNYRISFGKLDLELANVDVDPIDLKFGECDATLQNDGVKWTVNIAKDAFEACGVTKTQTGKLRIEVSLAGNEVVHKLPTECNPNKQVISTDVALPFDTCDVEGQVGCSGHPQKTTITFDMQDIKTCKITLNDIINKLSGCNASTELKDSNQRSQLMITFNDERSSDCAINLDTEGYFVEIELSSKNITMLFSEACQRLSGDSTGITGSNLEMQVLSHYSEHNSRPIKFPANIDLNQSNIIFVKIYSLVSGQDVHIDSCSVMTTQSGFDAEQEQLIRNNCPVHDNVRFLTPFKGEEGIQYMMVDVGKILKSRATLEDGSFYIQCLLQACYHDNGDVKCLFSHGKNCKRRDIIPYTVGNPENFQTVRTGLFRVSLTAAPVPTQTSSSSIYIIVAIVACILTLVIVVISCICKRSNVMRRRFNCGWEKKNMDEANSNGVSYQHSKTNGKHIEMKPSDVNGSVESRRLLDNQPQEISSVTDPGVLVHKSASSSYDEEDHALLSNNQPSVNKSHRISACTIPINFSSLREDVL